MTAIGSAMCTYMYGWTQLKCSPVECTI